MCRALPGWPPPCCRIDTHSQDTSTTQGRTAVITPQCKPPPLMAGTSQPDQADLVPQLHSGHFQKFEMASSTCEHPPGRGSARPPHAPALASHDSPAPMQSVSDRLGTGITVFNGKLDQAQALWQPLGIRQPPTVGRWQATATPTLTAAGANVRQDSNLIPRPSGSPGRRATLRRQSCALWQPAPHPSLRLPALPPGASSLSLLPASPPQSAP